MCDELSQERKRVKEKCQYLVSRKITKREPRPREHKERERHNRTAKEIRFSYSDHDSFFFTFYSK